MGPRATRARMAAVVVAVTALATGTLAPGALAAQTLPDSFGGPSSDPDFLFDRPRVSVGIRGGMFFHRADSDLFDFAEERFTLDRSEFRGPAFGIEGTIWLGSRAEATLAMDASRATVDSEYRDWVEDDGTADGLPIRQTTRIVEGPVFSLGMRYYLRDRGRQLGRFAWVPASWNAFLSGGGALAAYQLQMQGDFVDELEGTIYTAEFDSSGGAGQLFAGGGLEANLSTRTSLVLEGRYVWSDTDLGSDFAADFEEPLDLSGARVSLGLHLRAF